MGALASMRKQTTSTALSVSNERWLSRRPSSVLGLWMPGVSINTAWPSGMATTPRTWLRVVWGLSETMDTFSPTRRLRRGDFPTFGRPTGGADPEREPPDDPTGTGTAPWRAP